MTVLGLTRSLALAPFGPIGTVGASGVGTGHDVVARWSGDVIAQRSLQSFGEVEV